MMFELPDVQDRQPSLYNSAQGAMLTSAGNAYGELWSLPGASNLCAWIESCVCKPGQGVRWLRSWANRMYRGSHVLAHQHQHPDFSNGADFVAVFYQSVPPACAQLIFVESAEYNTDYRELDAQDQYILITQAGDLVIHSPAATHAVTEHRSDLPRTSLILEGCFEANK
jgi:hypothetical protein